MQSETSNYFFVWSTIILAIWSALGPIFGVWYGHRMQSSWQKRQWVTESKLKEYQELLGALTNSFSTIISLRANAVVLGPEDQRQLGEAEQAALEVLRNRVFLFPILEKKNILNLWIQATRDYDNGLDVDLFSKRFGTISRLIREAALQDM
jgi:hypothetical protein